MKDDEIKEILDKLRKTVDYPKLNYSSYDKSYNETIDNVAMIKSFACKQLLDYITNLQQENEELKELVNPKKTQIFIDTQDMEERYGEELYKEYLEKQIEDYKSRVEKAVEYIKIYFVEDIITVKTLLNILNGRSDE